MSSRRTTEVRRYAVDWVRKGEHDVANALVKQFGFTRQTASWHLAALVREGALSAKGRTKARRYALAHTEEFSKFYEVANLQEHLVWADVREHLADLPANVLGICQFGLTEMVNNAIDHSESEHVVVSVDRGPGVIELDVQDFGVGIFAKIQTAFDLPDPRAVVVELTKGKLTTDKDNHTGEGIFFTSRIFDWFSVLSGPLFWRCAIDKRDWLLEDRTATGGTQVSMRISPWTTRTFRSVLAKYSAGEEGDYAFNRTEVPVLVATFGDDNLVSRSAARRVLARLEQFVEVLLNFDGVATIGPAFADEIFRVFPSQHPEAQLRPINMTRAVSRMVRRAEQAKLHDETARQVPDNEPVT